MYNIGRFFYCIRPIIIITGERWCVSFQSWTIRKLVNTSIKKFIDSKKQCHYYIWVKLETRGRWLFLKCGSAWWVLKTKLTRQRSQDLCEAWSRDATEESRGLLSSVCENCNRCLVWEIESTPYQSLSSPVEEPARSLLQPEELLSLLCRSFFFLHTLSFYLSRPVNRKQGSPPPSDFQTLLQPPPQTFYPEPMTGMANWAALWLAQPLTNQRIGAAPPGL